MKPVTVNAQFAIYDDVLPEPELAAVWRLFCEAPFQLAHADGVRGFFRPSDGTPYLAQDIAWTQPAVLEQLPQGVSPQDLPIQLYPTGEAYDGLLDRVREAAAAHTDLVGCLATDWVGIVAKLYGYPADAGISWHTDDAEFTGSFIFYANPKWDVQWDGELFVAHEGARDALPRTTLHAFGSRSETEVLMAQGFGQYILPKPNRLVLLAAGHPHKVVNVSKGAGDHIRGSLAGFFVKPTHVQKLVEEALQA